MKSIEKIVEGYKSQTLDGRDLGRLAKFLTEEECVQMGLEFREEFKGKHVAVPWTRDNILAQLEKDVAFGFEKALDKRGISATLMHAVVRMWNLILEEGLENIGENDYYAQYGLPLFRTTAVKYGFANPIGEKTGTEYEFSSEYEED